MVSLVFFDILQLPHTVISNSEKLTHPSVPYNLTLFYTMYNTFPFDFSPFEHSSTLQQHN